MKRIRTTLALVALLASMAFTFAPTASAHMVLPGGDCSTAVANFYGNENYQSNVHFMRVCYGYNALRLSAITDSDGGNCAGFFGIDDGDWNNCITSTSIVFFNVPSGVKLCLYVGDNYTGNVLVVVGSWNSSRLPAGWDDTISSLKWSTTC